jgi:hypothetical protein
LFDLLTLYLYVAIQRRFISHCIEICRGVRKMVKQGQVEKILITEPTSEEIAQSQALEAQRLHESEIRMKLAMFAKELELEKKRRSLLKNI